MYSISTALTYSPNMVRVLVDYVVNDPFGPRLVAADLNLKALYEAQETAGEVVQGENNMLDNVAVPDSVNMDAETNAGYTDYAALYAGRLNLNQFGSGIIPHTDRRPAWHGRLQPTAPVRVQRPHYNPAKLPGQHRRYPVLCSPVRSSSVT